MYSILVKIGIYAPILFFFISIFLLYNQPTFLIYYIGGFIFNNIINIILKVIIKQPRPKEDNISNEILTKNNKENAKNERHLFDLYGMPSGHAQNFGFSLIYIFNVFKDPFITAFYLLIGIISLWQRYEFKNHTIFQLLVGFIIGFIIGYIVYKECTNKIKGELVSKPDDNAPL
jgi:membrane-associated phospholipid phosphatase